MKTNEVITKYDDADSDEEFQKRFGNLIKIINSKTFN